ncbi:MAG: ankyrin repeat domain-containing protein, partial [Bdellovibrionales bacterium]|nr:ankyrin repeat domain-containing protein [Bdellovibrionales bacterium]
MKNNLNRWIPFLFLLLAGHNALAANCSDLFDCIKQNDRDGLAERLRGGANPNVVNSLGNSPLGVAAAYGRRELVGLLVGHGANLNFQNRFGDTPLMNACLEAGHLDTAVFLLQAGANPNLRKANGGTALTTSGWYGHTAIVERLLQFQADPTIQDEFGETALTYALQRQKPETALVLARTGKGLGAANQDGRFALFWAGREGYLEVARTILDQGAPVNQATKNGVTALHGAAFTGKADVMALFLDRGAAVNARSVNGATPLHDAVGYLPAATLLLDRGADVNALTVRKESPLFLAASGGHLPVVQLLASRGANMNLANDRGETPLIVSSRGHSGVALDLLDRGADPNPVDSEGRSALWPAIYNDDQPLLESLLRHKANPNVESKYAETPLIIAIRRRQLASAERLIAARANLEQTTQNQATALCVSIDEGQREIFDLLVGAGAGINTRCYNAGPLHVSVFRRDRNEFLRRLLELGANTEIAGTAGYTPLMSAVDQRNTEAIQLLLARGADVNARNDQRDTPLKIALSMKSLEMFQLLLSQPLLRLADVVDHYGNTILHLAIQMGTSGHPFLDALLAKGAPLETRNDLGTTAIGAAVAGNHPEAVAKLVAAGADPNVPVYREDGPGVLSQAIEHGRTKIVESLLQSPKIDVRAKDSRGYAPISYAIREATKGGDDWVPALRTRGATLRITPTWAAMNTSHHWVLDGIGPVAPAAPSTSARTITIETDPALFEQDVTVEVRNLYTRSDRVFSRAFRSGSPEGSTYFNVTDAEVFQATGAKINQNALEARYILKAGSYEFWGRTEKPLHVFQHRPILFLPGIFGSQIWVSNPDGYPEFPQAPIAGGGDAFPRLQCNAAGAGVHSPVKLDLFREYKFDSIFTRVYHKVENREEVHFPREYKALYALPSAHTPAEPRYQVPYFKVYPWPYDWR